MTTVLGAAVWGTVAAAGLLFGGIVGLRTRPSREAVGRIMAFGAGTLVAAVTLDLTVQAVDLGGEPWFLLGLLAGGLVFYLADRALIREEAIEEATSGADTARSIVLASLLDGVPESAAIGLAIAAQDRVPVALVVAAFVGNVPEGLVPSVDFVRAGRSRRWVLGVWGGLCAISAVAAVVGYLVLAAMPDSVDAVVQAFAAGTILAMLSMTLIPDALQRAGRLVGLWTVVGYAVAAIIATSTT